MNVHHPIRILMVCTGNICRSPTAEAVLRAKAMALGLSAQVVVDSAGIEAYHVGAPPDSRSQEHARRRGYDMGDLRARQVSNSDFEQFDWLLAMDRWHLASLKRRCPPALAGRLRLFMAFADGVAREVPDPYYSDSKGFETVLDLVETGCDALLERLRAGPAR
ncbi:MAG: low molecular weight phosphotyrosine protein phosphatase [Vitreoscilla sp.]|nr:low molecular weight phosphotyrosine protein phosphatase [Vitreoscilla sp.]